MTLSSRGLLPFRAFFASTLYANSVFLIAANTASAALGFVFWIVAARLYQPHDVGLAAAAISASGLLVALSTLGLDQAIVRFLPGAAKPQIIVSSSLIIGGAAALVASVIFVAGLGLWSPGLVPLRSNGVFDAGFTVATVCMTLAGLGGGVFIAEGQARLVLAQSGAFGIIKALAVVAAAAVGGAAVLVGAWALGALILATVSLWFWLPRLRAGALRVRMILDRETVNRMAGFAFANYVATALGAASTSLLPLLVVNLNGPEAAGHFYIAFAISSLVATIPMMVAVSLFAHGSADAEEMAMLVVRSLRLALWLTTPAVIVGWVFGDKFLLLFGRSYSAAATHTLRLLLLAVVPLTVNALFFAVRKVQKHMDDVVIGTAWVLAVTLGIGFWLLPRVGLVGIGAAYLVAQSSLAVAVLGRYARRWRTVFLDGAAG